MLMRIWLEISVFPENRIKGQSEYFVLQITPSTVLEQEYSFKFTPKTMIRRYAICRE